MLYFDKLEFAGVPGVRRNVILLWSGEFHDMVSQISTGNAQSFDQEAAGIVEIKIGMLGFTLDADVVKDELARFAAEVNTPPGPGHGLGKQDALARDIIIAALPCARRYMNNLQFIELLREPKVSYQMGLAAGVRHAKRELKLWLNDDESKLDLAPAD